MMIEIFNIFYLLLFLSILINNNFFNYLIIQKLNQKNSNIINLFSINILLIMFIFLIFSFLDFKILHLLFIFFSISLLSFLTAKKKIYIKKIYIINFCLFFILCLILSIDLIANPKLEWDGHGWYFQALNFRENYNFFNLHNSDRFNSPHLGGIFWGIVWNISLLDFEFYGRIFYVILYICAVVSISENVSNHLFNKILISLVLVILTYDKFLFSGYQEILVFSILAILCNIISKFNLKKITNLQIVFITLISTLLIWSKNEGVIFYIIFISYLIFYQNFKKKLVIALISFTSIILKLHFVNSLSFINLDEFFDFSLYNNKATIINLEIFLDKFLYILFHMIVAMFKYPIWVLFVIILFIKKDYKKNYKFIFFSLMSIFSIFFIFLLNEVDDYKWLISGSLDRIIFQASAFLLIYVAQGINLVFKRFEY